MKVSVIIPTLNRPDRVVTLLQSLSANTRQPDEIILVEQGDIEQLEQTVGEWHTTFLIHTIYQAVKSTAIARNTGAEKATGDIFIFLDDDMEIGTEYIKTAIIFLQENPKASAVYGSYTKDELTWTFKRFLGVLFCVYSFRARNVVLPSGSYDYIRGKNLIETQTVQWMPSGNMVIRATLLQEFIFYPYFLRWSFGEDAMFSYQIHKRYPDTLYYLPALEVAHHHGTEQKMIPDEVIKMKIIYRYIFWKKEVTTGSFLYTLAYLWSQVGLLALDVWHSRSLHTVKVALSAYNFLYKHRRGIIDNKIDYNDFIFST